MNVPARSALKRTHPNVANARLEFERALHAGRLHLLRDQAELNEAQRARMPYRQIDRFLARCAEKLDDLLRLKPGERVVVDAANLIARHDAGSRRRRVGKRL